MCLCVTGVYEQLLARRGPLLEDAVVPGAGVVLGGSGDGAARHALRLRLLASLAAHCRIVVREELALGLAGQVRARPALLLRAGRCFAVCQPHMAGCRDAAGFRCRGNRPPDLPVLPCVTCAPPAAAAAAESSPTMQGPSWAEATRLPPLPTWRSAAAVRRVRSRPAGRLLGPPAPSLMSLTGLWLSWRSSSSRASVLCSGGVCCGRTLVLTRLGAEVP